jgi:hypothetical protein
MIIFIVVSGIIVFGVIITVKYYNEEDVDKIGPALKRAAMWHSHKDSDVSESVEVKCLPSKDKLGGYLVPYNMTMGGRAEDQL